MGTLAIKHGKAVKANKRFIDEDLEFAPKKKETFKREPHKTMRYAQI